MRRLAPILAVGVVAVAVVPGAVLVAHPARHRRPPAVSGQVRAYAVADPRTRSAVAVEVRLSAANRAREIGVAVYASAAGRPSRLLSSGFAAAGPHRAGLRVALTPVTLHAHGTYWVAVLGVHGTLGLAQTGRGGCTAQLSAGAGLQSFPSRWFPGRRSSACPLAARLVTRPGAVPAVGFGRNCVRRPSACGYPDATNTGPPPGATLRRSGTIRADRAGEVISGVSVHDGDIEVRADDVTIEDSSVTAGDGTLGSNWAIYIAEGVHGTVIRNTELSGRDCGRGSLLAGVWNTSGDRLTLDHDRGRCIDDILHGPGRLLNSYSVDDAHIPGDHYEPVADDGGGGAITIEHDTLINTHDQTAAVFVSCLDGPVSSMTVADSLLAGGDYVLYGPASDGPCTSATGPQTVIDNRFSRAYFPRGGYYGTGVDFTPGHLTWRGNVWDSTLRRVGH